MELRNVKCFMNLSPPAMPVSKQDKPSGKGGQSSGAPEAAAALGLGMGAGLGLDEVRR